jgi:hypothetical protein
MLSSEDQIQPESLLSAAVRRRQVITTIGMAGAGLVASSTASAFPSKNSRIKVSSNSPKPNSEPISFRSVLEVPDHWAQKNRAASDYHRYLRSLQLKRVDPAQVIESHAKSRGGVWNSLPPKKWWKRMGYVLKVVDRIAREMNVDDVEVISAYRSPAYNARCRGAKSGSWHKANVAADVKFPVRASKVTKMARELRNLGLFNGGVGGYWNFTHIDARGKNANW